MPPTRFEPSSIKNRHKREEVHRSTKKAKGQEKLKRRLALAEAERKDPSLKQVRVLHRFFKDLVLTLLLKRRIAENVPHTLDNTREFNPSIIPVVPPPAQNEGGESSEAGSGHPDIENTIDIENDQFAEHFNATAAADFDPANAPKVLITTSQKATKMTIQFCEELVSVFPGAEFIRRKRGHGFEMGRIAGWAGNRGYGAMMVVNEDMKKPSAFFRIYSHRSI
jgi:ribosome production factor 1